ncbi:hypothetical protein TNCT_290661 [Trichonephila clavata]|uniref:Uncharacterized protein n=1 Tax=Trichonephila clavata TaxID=2740835 RepID=A0A8X6GMW8_TRICU|nr:hypothetical protein TNCT_290661 [Trichonephila clavata]
MCVSTVLQSVKLLLLRYMATPPDLRLVDNDTTTDDEVAICLRLAALKYDLRSKPGHTHWHGIFQQSLADCQIIRLVDDGISYVF